jgi:hypothetical protein
VVVTPVSDVPLSAIPVHENVPVPPSETGSPDELLGTLPFKCSGAAFCPPAAVVSAPPLISSSPQWCRQGVVVAVAKAPLVDGPDTPWNPT